MNNLIVELPFSGFYGSSHEYHIDNTIEYLSDDYSENGLSAEQVEKIEYKPIFEAVCKHYIEAYNQVFYDEYNIHLNFKFNCMTSPQFYNFETDRLYAEVEQDVFTQIIALLSDDVIQSKLKSKYKTCDGYFVFESTLEAIEQKDYERFSADLLEMLLPENTVIENYQFTDNISEVVMNAINWDDLESEA